MLLERSLRRPLPISLTPLIDVVFILLLFFMLSSTFSKTSQLELQAAASGSTHSTGNQRNKVLLLTDNQVELNGHTYTIGTVAFAQQLRNIATNRESVTVAAIATVRVQETILLIDLLRSAGILQLDLSPSVAP